MLVDAQGKTFRVIRVFRGQPGLVGRQLKVESRATEMCKRGGGMALSLGGFATFATFAGKPTRAINLSDFASWRETPAHGKLSTFPNPEYVPIPHQY